MTIETLIDGTKTSDAGGVAGRVGFEYQDHVGAAFVIDMLRDSSLVQVEFETGDDIVLRWRMQYGTLNEYVQVKTTEGDAKWSLKDLTMRSEGKVGSSLAEKSLKCDTFDGDVCFRFVSKRDVGSGLKALTVPRNNRRAVTDKIASIVKSVGSKYKTIKSPKERTLTNWASALFWQVEGSIETLTNKNINRIIQHAEVSGEIPSFSQATDIYHDLLRIVADAGNASRVANPDCKAVSRDSAIEWWKRQLDGLRTANRANLKVYRVSTSAFFSRLHHIDEAHILRSMRSYDVEFDEKIWRREELVSHLLDWLPEISLPAKVLAEFSYLDARGLTQRAVQAFESTGSVSDEALFAELFMHAILRHYFDSEPIACKVFHGTGKNSGKTSAHIIPQSSGDELWLGRSRVGLLFVACYRIYGDDEVRITPKLYKAHFSRHIEEPDEEYAFLSIDENTTITLIVKTDKGLNPT